MAFKLLNNLLGLQIPNVNLLVLTTTDDPFAASDAKAGKNTILVVLVAAVRLETLARVVVPQANGIVQRRRKDIFAIGRELDKGSI